MEHKLYRIKWLDSTSIYGWVHNDDLDKKEILEINSVAFLVKEYEDCIVVACHIATHCVDAPLYIPKVAIISMEEINNGREEEMDSKGD